MSVHKGPATYDVEEIRARAAGATPGPWLWDGTMPPNGHVQLMSDTSGRPLVMGFTRLGSRGGQPEFATGRDNADPGWSGAGIMRPAIELALTDGRCHRPLLAIQNPDAEFIARARQDVDDLLAEIDHLNEELHPSTDLVPAGTEEPVLADARPVVAAEAWCVLKFKKSHTTSFTRRRPTALDEIDEDRVLKAVVVQATNGEEAIQTAYRDELDQAGDDRAEADGHYVASPLLRVETTQAVLVGEWKADMEILAEARA